MAERVTRAAKLGLNRASEEDLEGIGGIDAALGWRHVAWLSDPVDALFPDEAGAGADARA